MLRRSFTETHSCSIQISQTHFARRGSFVTLSVSSKMPAKLRSYITANTAIYRYKSRPAIDMLSQEIYVRSRKKQVLKFPCHDILPFDFCILTYCHVSEVL